MINEQRIIGIDPGLQNTGWGILRVNGNHINAEQKGTITTSSKDNDSYRLTAIYNELYKLLQIETVDACVVEEIFTGVNAKSALRLGEARGIILLVAGLHSIPVFTYHNRTVKKTIAGTGNASKDQMMFMIKQLIPNAWVDTDHEADAFSLALTHSLWLHSYGSEARIL